MFLGYSNFYKGFKCLDPKEGQVYISRDVVFDEHVFPFATLNPNIGARLRSEFALLLEVLQNPSSNFGDAILHDQHVPNSTSTDGMSSPSVCDLAAGETTVIYGEKMQPNTHDALNRC